MNMHDRLFFRVIHASIVVVGVLATCMTFAADNKTLYMLAGIAVPSVFAELR